MPRTRCWPPCKTLIATISLIFAFGSTAGASTAAAAHAQQPALGSCTMAVAPTHTTVEVEIANAADFCEIVSQALAVDVFGAPVLVTPGVWHYADAERSCRLRYGTTRYRMTISNSAAACRWLARLAPAWHVEREVDVDVSGALGLAKTWGSPRSTQGSRCERRRMPSYVVESYPRQHSVGRP
jgi:hypothetical protein